MFLVTLTSVTMMTVASAVFDGVKMLLQKVTRGRQRRRQRSKLKRGKLKTERKKEALLQRLHLFSPSEGQAKRLMEVK